MCWLIWGSFSVNHVYAGNVYKERSEHSVEVGGGSLKLNFFSVALCFQKAHHRPSDG